MLCQYGVRDAAEKFSTIHIQHPAPTVLGDPASDRLQRIVCATSTAVAVGTVAKVDLIDRLQQQDDGTLCHLVLKRGNSKTSLTAAICLVNVMTANRRRTVAA